MKIFWGAVTFFVQTSMKWAKIKKINLNLFVHVRENVYLCTLFENSKNAPAGLKMALNAKFCLKQRAKNKV